MGDMVDSNEQPDSPYLSRAIEFLADNRFHRSLWLPPNPENGRSSPLRVTYSDLGNSNGEPLIVCGGLFGSRYTLALADELAKAGNVRLITPDKPGIGGTGPVDMEHKVKTWFEILPFLTQHLHLRHISLLGHSSGAIYILNTLLHPQLRALLHPTRPYVALFAPWVRPAHSSAREAPTPALADMMPDWAVRWWYGGTHFVAEKGIRPMLGPSTARPGVEMAQKAKKDGDRGEGKGDGEEEEERKDGDDGGGGSVGWASAVDEKVMEYALIEDVEGVSQEALFCLGRGGDEAWGGWGDYGEFIELLKKGEAGGGEGKEEKKVRLDVYFAEEDNTSSVAGSKWFDELWKREAEDCVDYTSETVPGTTHETIMRAEKGALERVFARITSTSSEIYP